MDVIPKQTIFVELDALLDTRAACIASFGKEAIEQHITAGYYTRLTDAFSLPGYVDKFRSRDKELLKDSMITPVFNMIVEFVSVTLKNNINSPQVYKPCVIVNTYPYILSDAECSKIVNILVHKTQGEADINIVTMDYDELTPSYVRQNVSLMVMYHAIDWLEAQADAGRFTTRACPDVSMLCPALGRGSKPLIDKDPFEVMETVSAPIIGLKFLPIESFCMIYNPFKQPK
jgi:hypothetical protein